MAISRPRTRGRNSSAAGHQTWSSSDIWGSSELLQTLIAAELVDEYRIWVFPLVLGEGKRLFENGVPRGGLDAKHAQGRPHHHIPPGRFAPAGDTPS